MASTIGIEGNITSDDATTTKDLYHILNSGIKPFQFSAQIPTELAGNTGFATTVPNSESNISGLRSWTANFSGYFPRVAGAMGHEGLITYGSMSVGSGYVLGATGYSLNLSCGAYRDTEQAATAPTWDEFIPGIISGTGTMDVRIDDTTAIEFGTEGAVTFRLNDEGAGEDNTISGSIIVTNVGPSVAVGQKNVAQISFSFTGDLTADGDNPLFPVTTPGTEEKIVKPDITDVVLRASGSRDYDGSAFWTSIAIQCAIGSPVQVTGTLQGTGALTAG